MTLKGLNDEALSAMKVKLVKLDDALLEVRWWGRLSRWTRISGLAARMLSWK